MYNINGRVVLPRAHYFFKLLNIISYISRKIAEPATITLAPASRIDARFPAFTPPSISISVSSPLASNKVLISFTLSSDSGMNFCPQIPD